MLSCLRVALAGCHSEPEIDVIANDSRESDALRARGPDTAAMACMQTPGAKTGEHNGCRRDSVVLPRGFVQLAKLKQTWAFRVVADIRARLATVGLLLTSNTATAETTGRRMTASSYEDLMANMLGDSGDSQEQSLNRSVFQDDAVICRARLRRRSRGLISNAKFLSYWDLVILLAVLYTMMVTPFEVALVPASHLHPASVLSILNILLNVVFAADMLLQFFLPIREPAKKGGRLIRSQ